ncbi:MAG: response regulator [Syntrophobacteraceae bacterium]|nr:response regulator [Syntrophobacteraceae bacterium]
MTLRECCSTIGEFEGDPARRGQEPLVVLIADDEEQHYVLVEKALQAAATKVDLRWVTDGGQAMDYLLRRGRYAEPWFSPRPDLILLDLVMPVKDGLETLKEIKGNGGLRGIPLMLLAPSRIRGHEDSWLRLGADSFIIKPLGLDEMVAKLLHLKEHYFGIIRLPDHEVSEDHDSEKSKFFPWGGARLRSIDRRGANSPLL